MDPLAIIAIVIAVLAVVIVLRSVKVIPQAQAAVIERLGRYNKTSSAGLVWLMPFLDRIRARIDMREQVVSFPPQPVITQDNLTVSIDTVVYFQVNEPRAAVYEIANYIVAVEQLTTTTLRNVVGGMTPGADADLARLDQRPAARRARRGHRQVGHPGRPGRAEVDRPAALHPGLDGEADARRP